MINQLHKRRHSEQRGSALVELSLVLPLLVVMALGATSFGTALGEKQMIVEAVRYGARRAAAEGFSDCTPAGSPGILDRRELPEPIPCNLVPLAELPAAGASASEIAEFRACQFIEKAGMDTTQWQVSSVVDDSGVVPAVVVRMARAVPAGVFVSALMGSAFPSSQGDFVLREKVGCEKP